jgi:hypothetical protein
MKDKNTPNYIFEAKYHNSLKNRAIRFRKKFRKNLKRRVNSMRQYFEYLYTLLTKREQ